ncbi:unnamed protein product [Rotaria magnacalcarata]|uniref:CBM1 domain-containing protein n=1 Tax=Rotaria magnacalcarata TaxID=392030 RepID=A0A816YWB0_9BILA|nr:unnamed protein product [Rotaria magnacalcarata]CAF1581747.1 unnamed protein product [Rotaria magnacalcarata]CAF1933713.1 unnamed protein product [Rotaria magnacalcarata]CAF2085441.1 unnamed protein product [Rotaria magnacalcarata]CAF2173133.1 unnamed protein product [Rotaria magnacalcarata]
MISTFLVKLALLVTVIDIAYSVAIYEQCAGEGYGNFPCDNGMTCFRRNKWFSSCQYSCPLNLGWECETYIAVTPGYAAQWAQCAGEGWGLARPCPAGYACYARSIYYSQCRPIGDCPSDWGCYALFHTTTPIPRPVTLPAYAKCNNVINAVCPTGTACFRNNALYAECRPACPPTWACETDVVGEKEQCGGEGYVGLTRCAEGLRCYARSQWYAQCAPSCPGADFIC